MEAQTNSMPNVVEKHVWLEVEQANHLVRLAQTHRVHEDQIIKKALDIFFSLTDLLDEHSARPSWAFLSQAALQRVWDNEADAIYDNWRELYGVPAQ